MLKDFKNFIMRGNVIDLAVAVVIGAAFGNVISSMVKDIITPLIGIIGGKPDVSSIVFIFEKNKFLVGDFINSLISFVLIAAIIYFLVVLPISKVTQKFKKKEKSDSKICPECLSSIPLKAKRCAYCTSVLK